MALSDVRSDDSLRKLKMEHGIPLSDDSYRALAMAQQRAQQQEEGSGMMPPPAPVAMMDQYAPDPISARQEAEIMAQNQWRAAPQSVQETQHVRQDTLTTSNISRPGGGGSGSGDRPDRRRDLRGSLQRMGRLPSIRTRLGADIGGDGSGMGLVPQGDSNRSNVTGTNFSNMSLMSDISAIGNSTASGLSHLVGGGPSARGMDDMDISARGLNSSQANLEKVAGSKVSVWDASESTRDMASLMKPKRELSGASGGRGGKIMAYMADARSNQSPTGGASVGSGLSVDSRREMFAKTRKKARGPPPRTIVTANAGGQSGKVGDANASGASDMTSIGMSKASINSGILSMTSGLASKQSFKTGGTGSISTLSWKSSSVGAAATATTSPGRNTEHIVEASHRSIDSFGMAVDDMLGTGMESGRSVTSNFSRMSLMSDFDTSLDFSSKDFSSRDCSNASAASRNLAAGDSGSGGASSSGRSSSSPHANEGRGKMLGTILGSHNEDDDFDDVE